MPDVEKNINVGVAALLVNAAVLAGLSAMTAGRRLPLATEAIK